MQSEILGVVGTTFIVIAFMQNGEARIRRLDLLGAIFFIIYGIAIRSFSTILLNSILTAVQIVKLVKLRNRSETDTVSE